MVFAPVVLLDVGVMAVISMWTVFVVAFFVAVPGVRTATVTVATSLVMRLATILLVLAAPAAVVIIGAHHQR